MCAPRAPKGSRRANPMDVHVGSRVRLRRMPQNVPTFEFSDEAKQLRQFVYEHWCAPCHAPGQGHPGTQSLQLKYKGQLPAVLLDRTDLMPQTVSTFVRQGVLLMAPFRKTEITDAELSALSAYVARNFKAAPK